MKIGVVGGGNGGCFTALHYAFHTRQTGIEIELIHNPDVFSEKVGQATVLDPPQLLFAALGFDWYDNPIHATMKSGILYEGWGKVNDKLFHPFPADRMAMHYCPWEMQEYVLNAGHFKVTQGDVDPKDVDADYVFDCRGKPKDFSDYETLKNPLNSAILAKPKWDTTKALWSRHIATPDGWTFIIPTVEESPSHDYCVGYLYNSNITSKEEAEKNLLNMFDVEVKNHLAFNNYLAKNPVVDDRIFLNGNRLSFIEPLESSATQIYLQWARYVFDIIITNQRGVEDGVNDIKNYIHQVQNFILWHYQFGSQYDTPFWDYAKTLTFDDNNFNMFLRMSNDQGYGGRLNPGLQGINQYHYGYWHPLSFKNWDDGMTRQLTKDLL